MTNISSHQSLWAAGACTPGPRPPGSPAARLLAKPLLLSQAAADLLRQLASRQPKDAPARLRTSISATLPRPGSPLASPSLMRALCTGGAKWRGEAQGLDVREAATPASQRRVRDAAPASSGPPRDSADEQVPQMLHQRLAGCVCLTWGSPPPAATERRQPPGEPLTSQPVARGGRGVLMELQCCYVMPAGQHSA